jgi:hypothetical protein
MCNLPIVFRWAPFLWQCTICMILFMGPNEWASSLRCFAKLGVLLLLWKAVLCSLYRVGNHLPVYPTYVLSQSGQISLQTSDRENLSWVWCLWVNRLPKVLVVRYAIFSSVRQKMLVMYEVYSSTFIKLAHFCVERGGRPVSLGCG